MIERAEEGQEESTNSRNPLSLPVGMAGAPCSLCQVAISDHESDESQCRSRSVGRLGGARIASLWSKSRTPQAGRTRHCNAAAHLAHLALGAVAKLFLDGGGRLEVVCLLVQLHDVQLKQLLPGNVP